MSALVRPGEPGLPLPLSGATRVFAILGDPIAQAGSPALFNAAFRRKGIEAVLVPLHVGGDGLDAMTAAFRSTRNFDGLVITVPHKIAIRPFIDVVGPMAERVGAVNAIRKLPDGRLFGDNFDGVGFVRGLARRGHSLRNRRVLLVGAGGAGRAVAHAVLDEEPAVLAVFDLDADRVSALLDGLRRASPGAPVRQGEPDAAGYDVVVNCTSLGMVQGDPLPVRTDRLDPRTLVVDIVLKPAETPLLQEAARRGCPVQPGLHMLEGQVEEICRFFDLPRDAGDA